MLSFQKKIFAFRFRHAVLAAAICCIGMGAVAQDEPTPAEILKEAMQAMDAGRYDDAAASMYMYLGMVEESKAPRVIAIAQDIRFKLATILLKAEPQRLDEAAAVLQEYIDTPLAEKPRQAMKMLATCYFETEAYEEAVTAVTNALWYNDNPVLEASRVVKSRGDDEEVEKLDKKEPEPEFTQEELTMLNMTLAESYYKLEKWQECINPFSYVIANTPNEQRKGYSIMQVINALIKQPAFDEILEWVPQLYRTDARYDIRVNLALMNAAAALYDAMEYDSALPLYRMILPRDELITFQKGKLREMRIALGLPPEEDAEITEDDLLLFGGDDETAAEGEDGAMEEEKPKELLELEALIKALEDLPAYELDIKYRQADLYKTVERYWEALKFFDIVYREDPTSEVGERSIYEIVDTLIEDLGDIDEAKERAFEYMGKFKEGVTPRMIAYMLTGYYQGKQQLADIKPIKPYLDGMVRTNDETIVKYDSELYFMQAVADLVLQNYEESARGFKYVLDEFPGSHQEANATYWYGMSQMFLQKYVDAFPNFETYIKKFPTEQFVDECWFQGGVCLFGQEKYKEAMERFSYVIETYPDSSVYPEACSMRGDLYGAGEVYSENDYLDRAIDDYERAYGASVKVNQATYATFQAAEVYEAEDKYDDILRVVERYEADWGERGADVAKALFWIGKTKIQQKEYEDAVETYVNAIVKYGGDLRQDGVDSMISELVKIANIYLKDIQVETLVSELKAALAEAEELTLQLRLRVAVAKLEGTEIELGSQLIEELPNLDNASPPVLAVICDASFEKKDYSRAEELLRIFINKFEDSDFMRSAYKLRGYGQFAEKDYEGALATINDAQALYGTDYDVAWAQLMKAEILYEQGKLDGPEGARAANMSILTVPSWRGSPVAQATYQLGLVEEKAGNLKKAFGFYQRAYFQYKGHAGGYWAAEAYLASARVLEKMGPEYANDVRNTYRAMLFDRYVNELPQADVAREALGASEVAEIEAYIETGGMSNIVVEVETETLTLEPTTESATETSTETPAETEEGAQ